MYDPFTNDQDRVWDMLLDLEDLDEIAAIAGEATEHAAHFAVSAQKYLHSAASCTGSPASRIMRFRRPRFSGAMGYIGIRKCPACRPIRFMAVFTGMGLTSMNRALMRSR